MNPHEFSTPPTATALGRHALAEWVSAQPKDLFADDPDLQALISAHGLADRFPALSQAGRIVVEVVDPAARENDRVGNHPILESWDGIGREIAAVRHHPSYRVAGKGIYATGIMAAYAETGVDGRAGGTAARRPMRSAPHRFILSMFALTAQAGEAGHNCPLACDAGAIRALQQVGTAEQQAAYLPGLLDPDFDTNMTAAQFLTEVQGGSDVGANAVTATAEGSHDGGPGSPWTLTGEKWFCSNADASIFIVTARVAEPGTGTRGLGLFVVPKVRPDGSVNGFRIRRLKEKLGTRSLASGEIDFQGAHATALGPVDSGFRTVMDLVITTSRLYNAAGCAAHARRAWVVASTYAQYRLAFGQAIGQYPLVAETLAWMRADAVACLSGTLLLGELQERNDEDGLSAADSALFRIGVNLNKLQTSVLAHETINRGIEVLGGNGAIETFSVLPRLLRDNVVFENWEGSHNVLRAQVLRDCDRFDLAEPFFAALSARLPEDAAALAADCRTLADLLTRDPHVRDMGFRRLGARMATWVMLAGMAGISDLDAAATLTRRHLESPDIDQEYVSAIAALQR